MKSQLNNLKKSGLKRHAIGLATALTTTIVTTAHAYSQMEAVLLSPEYSKETAAQVSAVSSSGARVIESELLTQQFTAGAPMVEVLVNLVPPLQQQVTNFRNATSVANMQAAVAQTQDALLLRRLGANMSLHHRLENQATLWVSTTAAGLEELRADPAVESIEPVRMYEAYDIQGLALMNAAATRQNFGGAGMAIAICDTGIDYRHPLLGGGGFPNDKVIGGFDFGDNDADPIPNGQAHGTACAGIAAGDLAIAGDYNGGVAPQAKLYALKISPGDTGSSNSALIAAAWDFCVTHQNDDPANPIMVISTSFGGGREIGNCDGQEAASRAAQNAIAAGMTVVVASGNDGFSDAIGAPACLSTVISVGAVYDASFGGADFGICRDNATAADQVTCYSNTSSVLSLLAPSHLAVTTDIVGPAGDSTGDFGDQFGGTSAACPYTAGAVAALQTAAKQQLGRFLSPAEVREILISTGDSITDPKAGISKPRVNLGRAIRKLADGRDDPKPLPESDDQFESNNTTAQMARIQPGSFQLVGNDSDFFILDIAQATTINVAIEGLGGNLDLVVADNQGQLLGVSNGPDSRESVQVAVVPPSVIILVTPLDANSTSTYAMSVELENVIPPLPGDDQFEENDDPEQAAKMTSGAEGLVGNDEDWFVVQTTEAGILSVSIDGQEGDLDMDVLQIQGQEALLLGSSANEGSTESLEVDVQPGLVFIRVVPFQGQGGTYSLSIANRIVPINQGPCGAGALSMSAMFAPLFLIAGQRMRRVAVRRHTCARWI